MASDDQGLVPLRIRRDDPVTGGILDRPFDFYVGFLVTFMGLYGFLDPTFPENLSTGLYWLVTIEDIYLVLAGTAVMLALVFKQLKVSIGRWIWVEHYAWVFIAAAAAVITLSSPWVPPTAIDIPNPAFTIVWAVLWSLLSAMSVIRAVRIRRAIKRWTR